MEALLSEELTKTGQEFQNIIDYNSYYYHRQENKLSGTETDSRFFLARGR